MPKFKVINQNGDVQVFDKPKEDIIKALEAYGKDPSLYQIIPADEPAQAEQPQTEQQQSLPEQTVRKTLDLAQFGLMPLYTTAADIFPNSDLAKGAGATADAVLNGMMVSGVGTAPGAVGKAVSLAGGLGAMGARNLAARAAGKSLKDIPVIGGAINKLSGQTAKTVGAEARLEKAGSVGNDIAKLQTEIKQITDKITGITKGKKGGWTAAETEAIENLNVQLAQKADDLKNLTDLAKRMDKGTFSEAAVTLPGTTWTRVAGIPGGAAQRAGMKGIYDFVDPATQFSNEMLDNLFQRPKEAPAEATRTRFTH